VWELGEKGGQGGGMVLHRGENGTGKTDANSGVQRELRNYLRKYDWKNTGLRKRIDGELGGEGEESTERSCHVVKAFLSVTQRGAW